MMDGRFFRSLSGLSVLQVNVLFTWGWHLIPDGKLLGIDCSNRSVSMDIIRAEAEWSYLCMAGLSQDASTHPHTHTHMLSSDPRHRQALYTSDRWEAAIDSDVQFVCRLKGWGFYHCSPPSTHTHAHKHTHTCVQSIDKRFRRGKSFLVFSTT